MIEINNLTGREINDGLLKKISESVLKEEGKEKENLSIAFVGPNRIRRLNREFKGKNRVTEILVFPNKKVQFGPYKSGDLREMEGIGEIVICPREIKKKVKRQGGDFEKELVKSLIFGILLLTREKKEEIEQKKEYYFSKYLK